MAFNSFIMLYELTGITLYVESVHHWLTHMPAVACGSLSQRERCQ